MRLGNLGVAFLAFSSAAQNVFGTNTTAPSLSVIASSESYGNEGPMPYNYFQVLEANLPATTEYIPFTPVGFFQTHQDYINQLKSDATVAEIFAAAAVRSRPALRKAITPKEFALDKTLMQFGTVKLIMQYLIDNRGFEPTPEAMRSFRKVAENVFAILQQQAHTGQLLESALLADKADWYVNQGHAVTAAQRIRNFLPNIIKSLAKLKGLNLPSINLATATYTDTIATMLKQKESEVLAGLNAVADPYAKTYNKKLPTISIRNAAKVESVYTAALYAAPFSYIEPYLTSADQNFTQAVSNLNSTQAPLLTLAAQAQNLILKSVTNPEHKTKILLNLASALRISMDDKFAARVADQLWHATQSAPRDADLMAAKIALYWTRSNPDYVHSALKRIKPGAAAARTNEQILINLINRLVYGVEHAIMAADVLEVNPSARNSTKLRP